MINLFKKVIFFTVIFNVIIFSYSKAETFEDIGKELSEIRDTISKLKTSNVEEAIKIDSALTELEQVVDFVENNVKNGNLDVAISSLNIAETTVKDISKSIPSEFKATTVEAGKAFSDKDMKDITSITDGLNENKAIKKQEMVNNIEVVQAEGLDVKTISQNISASGIKTSLITNTVNNNLVGKTTINKELADQEKYGVIIGNTPAKVAVAMKQVNVIQSGNPKDHRALEIEKFGLAAGLSSEQIQKGVEAVYSGNLKIESEITKEIFSKLSQNSDWTVESADIDAMMQQNIAVEKAASAILYSGIDFGAGTSNKAIDILSSQIETILAGNTDQATIDKITYKIGRTKYEIWANPNAVAANMIAEIAGPDQAHALVSIRNDQSYGITNSLVEQAARVESQMNGDIGTYIDAKHGLFEAKNLSSFEKTELSKVYSQALSNKNLSSSTLKNIGDLKSATSIVATSETTEAATVAAQTATSTAQAAAQSATETATSTAQAAAQSATETATSTAQAAAQSATSAAMSEALTSAAETATSTAQAAAETAQAAATEAAAAATQAAETAQAAATEAAAAATQAAETAQAAATEAAAEATAAATQAAASSAVQEAAQEVAEAAAAVAQEATAENVQEFQESALEYSARVLEEAAAAAAAK